MRRGSGNGGCGWAGGVFGRWSLRRLLLESPLVGRRLAQTVLDQSEPKPSRVSAEQSNSRSHTTTIEFEVEDDEGDTVECPLCLGTVEKGSLVRLEWCAHRCCETCLRQYLAIEICESRVPVTCPACHEGIHPTDVRRIVNNQFIFEKYEEFTVRRVLAADPDTRWCPAPDCNFAVVATGCASCPKLTCQAPGCGAMFCYHCKAAWHPTQTCDAARRDRDHEPRAQSSDHNEMEYGDVKPCPRCSVLIVKVEDGSCNHMVCCVCGAEFCWLCMKEVSDLHYLSPSGCTFWGKKPWSRKKKLLWQLGTLAGAPLGILVVAGVALPALLVGLPLWAGRRANRRLRRARASKRRAAVAAAVTAALIVSPLVAGLAVGIGVPILLFYVYGVVPVSLCRAGGCGEPPDNTNTLRQVDPSIGDASLSASSEARAASTAALAGSLASASPAPTSAPPSPTPTTHTHSSATPTHKSNPSATRAALLRAIFLYGTYPLPPDVEAGILAGNSPPPPPEETLGLPRSVTPQGSNIEIDKKSLK